MSYEIGFPGEYMDNAPQIDYSRYIYGVNGAPIIDEVEAEAKKAGLPEGAEFDTGFGRRLSMYDKIAWASPVISSVCVNWDYYGIPHIVFRAHVSPRLIRNEDSTGDDLPDVDEQCAIDCDVFEVDCAVLHDNGASDADILRHIPAIRTAWETVIRRHNLHEGVTEYK